MFVSAHQRRHPNCDCGACCDGCGHSRPCSSGLAPAMDLADEVAQEDGYIRATAERICPTQNG